MSNAQPTLLLKQSLSSVTEAKTNIVYDEKKINLALFRLPQRHQTNLFYFRTNIFCVVVPIGLI